MAALRELVGMSAQQYLLLRDQNPSVFGYNMQNEEYKLRKSGPDGKTNEKAIIIAMAGGLAMWSLRAGSGAFLTEAESEPSS